MLSTDITITQMLSLLDPVASALLTIFDNNIRSGGWYCKVFKKLQVEDQQN